MAEKQVIEFFIPWEVQPKQSFRARKVGRGHADPKVKANAGLLGMFAKKHRPASPLEGPLQLDVVVRYSWRHGESKKNRSLGELLKDTGPDWDNLGKQISDVLQACEFFRNDGQIADGRVRKYWGESVAGVKIRIMELTCTAPQ